MSRFWKPGTEKPRLVDDEEGGVLFYTASSSSSSGYGHASMEKQRQRLPVFKYRTAILYLVEKHSTTIIVGETGSGKTTQIPQYLKEAGWVEGGRMIACTQPRRLAVQEPMGDILVFLTGQDDIDAAIQLLSEDSHNRKQGLIVLPLYSGLPRADQDLVFSPTPRGKRKVVISTNIAETSLTLEGVVYVVDSGFSKQRFYNPRKVDEIRQQLRRIAQRIGIALKSCEGSEESSYCRIFNACRLESFSHNGLYKTVRGSQEVYIHPSSVLFRVNPKWVIFHSIVSTDRQYMRNVIAIDPSWLTDTAPQFYQHNSLILDLTDGFLVPIEVDLSSTFSLCFYLQNLKAISCQSVVFAIRVRLALLH
ncbi:putative pre-splicing factor ATP-dependent RNA helicase DEAH9 [Sesamum angolense]|uniref:RNA helicase n=1 Tax=Sesamum angolense TaxID=2727404 RepID=A0AAE1WTB8_9LAMI|nr:putative pre-splicing factor ATP-dependent RNA helicase DEAH9 [Sesamum angolense]